MLLSLVLDMISSMQQASILHIPSVLFIVPQFLHQKRLKLLSEIGDAHRAKLQNLGWPVSIEMGKIHAEEIGDQLYLLQVKLENEFEGRKILTDGSVIESEANFVQPTIVEISPRVQVVKEELPQGSDCGIVNVPTNGAGIVCSFGDDREAGSDS
ncbi:hypothetical protein FXO37_24113 [Capsicum annuum]|nr:hypothetical protein FXO37_24113 [Capsicum annuum]